MLPSRAVTPPAGTFLAKVRAGCILFPRPIKEWCDGQGWDLFRIVAGDPDRLVLEPVLSSAREHDPPSTPDDAPDFADDFRSSLSPDGCLWIPAKLRESVSLAEQNVMMRIESGGIGVYLRKVFDTLGFRP